MLCVWSSLTTLAAPGLRWALHRRALRGKEIAARLAERRGLAKRPRPPGKLIWLHAASVGETISLLPLLRALPGHINVLFTTGTVTSAKLLDERLPALGLDQRVFHQFTPLDVPHWVRRFLDHWRPDAVVFVESEIWPNMLSQSAARGLPLVLLQARMSPRSLRGWQRVPRLARRLIGCFERIYAQSEADAARFRLLGGREVSAPGNLKFHADLLPYEPDALSALQAALAGRPLWLAASTHKGEEEAVARIHSLLAPRFPGLLTIIVPRHPGRGTELATALRRPDLVVTQRSLGEAPPAEGIWLGDTLGEMGLFYRLSPIAFIGKSLGGAASGGQNPIEPAMLGCAVATGPATGNFNDPVALLREAGALHVAATECELADWVTTLLCDPARVGAIGQAAQAALGRDHDLPAALAAAIAGLA